MVLLQLSHLLPLLPESQGRYAHSPPYSTLEYKDLEARVDALKHTHQALLKITKVYETESYDYPTQITESMADLGAGISHSFSLFAEKVR